MSALPQTDSFFRQSERLTELEALQEIGRIANTAAHPVRGLQAIAQTALYIPTIHKVEILEGELLASSSPLSWRSANRSVNVKATLAQIEANGRTWGQLRLTAAGDVLTFATFLGQQIALLLNRVDLLHRNQTLGAQVLRLSERLETRKRLHRAGGLVARARGISDRAALQLLVDHARKSRRSLYRVAETVLLGYEQPFTRKPVLRRLPSHELTAKFS